MILMGYPYHAYATIMHCFSGSNAYFNVGHVPGVPASVQVGTSRVFTHVLNSACCTASFGIQRGPLHYLFPSCYVMISALECCSHVILRTNFVFSNEGLNRLGNMHR